MATAERKTCKIAELMGDKICITDGAMNLQESDLWKSFQQCGLVNTENIRSLSNLGLSTLPSGDSWESCGESSTCPFYVTSTATSSAMLRQPRFDPQNSYKIIIAESGKM